MTHGELVAVAARWLKRKHAVVCCEVASYAGEIPDAIGFTHTGATLIECKASRADFLRDLKKPHRSPAYPAMGNERYYLSTDKTIKEADLPEGWGLLHTSGTRVTVVKKSNRFNATHHHLMYSLLRRAVLRGFDPSERVSLDTSRRDPREASEPGHGNSNASPLGS